MAMEPNGAAERVSVVQSLERLLADHPPADAPTNHDHTTTPLLPPGTEVHELAPDAPIVTVDFASFYREHRIGLVRALAITLGDAALAREAVDEAMTRAFQRWRTVQHLDNPAGWVYRVALNWARSVRRRLRRRPIEPDASTVVVPAPTMADPSVIAALAELDVPKRAVVVCRYYLGWSEEETANQLGIRPGTVKSRLHRALAQLRDRLDHLRPEGAN